MRKGSSHQSAYINGKVTKLAAITDQRKSGVARVEVAALGARVEVAGAYAFDYVGQHLESWATRQVDHPVERPTA